MREPDEGFWLDSDDDRLRRRFKAQPEQKAPVSTTKPNTKPTTDLIQVSVNISLPRVRLPGRLKAAAVKSVRMTRSSATAGGKKIARLPRPALIAAAGLIVVAGIGGTVLSKRSSEPEVTSEVLAVENTPPEFKTVAPDAPTAQPIKYDPERKVASYGDKIDGINVTVSQQQLPDRFKDDPTGELEKLAKQFSANEKITAGEYTAYIGTSVKGPQSLITVRDDLLIFMFSESKVTNESWGKYITALQIQKVL